MASRAKGGHQRGRRQALKGEHVSELNSLPPAAGRSADSERERDAAVCTLGCLSKAVSRTAAAFFRRDASWLTRFRLGRISRHAAASASAARRCAKTQHIMGRRRVKPRRRSVACWRKHKYRRRGLSAASCKTRRRIKISTTIASAAFARSGWQPRVSFCDVRAAHACFIASDRTALLYICRRCRRHSLRAAAHRGQAHRAKTP